jgi:hypothetical protein
LRAERRLREISLAPSLAINMTARDKAAKDARRV